MITMCMLELYRTCRALHIYMHISWNVLSFCSVCSVLNYIIIWHCMLNGGTMGEFYCGSSVTQYFCMHIIQWKEVQLWFEFFLLYLLWFFIFSSSFLFCFFFLVHLENNGWRRDIYPLHEYSYIAYTDHIVTQFLALDKNKREKMIIKMCHQKYPHEQVKWIN